MNYKKKMPRLSPLQDLTPAPSRPSSSEPGIYQFVLLSLEAWERLRTLDRLLDCEESSISYYNLLHKKGGHPRRLNRKAFKKTKLLFGPQAIVLLLPAIGFLQKLDQDSPNDCESILADAGLKPPDFYSAELVRKDDPTCRSITHLRRQMLRCMRNAAGHHMENSLSLRECSQGIEMPSDGKYLIMRSEEYELAFRKDQWREGYLKMLDHISRAARKILGVPSGNPSLAGLTTQEAFQ